MNNKNYWDKLARRAANQQIGNHFCDVDRGILPFDKGKLLIFGTDDYNDPATQNYVKRFTNFLIETDVFPIGFGTCKSGLCWAMIVDYGNRNMDGILDMMWCIYWGKHRPDNCGQMYEHTQRRDLRKAIAECPNILELIR